MVVGCPRSRPHKPVRGSLHEHTTRAPSKCTISMRSAGCPCHERDCEHSRDTSNVSASEIAASMLEYFAGNEDDSGTAATRCPEEMLDYLQVGAPWPGSKSCTASDQSHCSTSDSSGVEARTLAVHVFGISNQVLHCRGQPVYIGILFMHLSPAYAEHHNSPLVQELHATDPAQADNEMFVMRGGVVDVDPELQDHPADAEAFFQQHGLPNVMVDDVDDDAGADPETPDAWSMEYMLQPLYPGCQYTVQQFCYAMFRIKTGSIHDDRADLLCKMLAQVMPEGYKGPKCVSLQHRRVYMFACTHEDPIVQTCCSSGRGHQCTDTYRSYHELKRANRVEPASTFEHHLCPLPKCSHVFPKIQKSEWEAHRNEICPHCHVGRRFKQSGGHLQASKRFASHSHNNEPVLDHDVSYTAVLISFEFVRVCVCAGCGISGSNVP